MSERIIKVALPTPLRRLFDYRLPLSALQAPPPEPGSRVMVPFGPRRFLTGVIIEITDQSNLPPEKLKRAKELIDTEAIFSTSLYQTLQWAASYYHHPLGEVIHAALPKKLRAGSPLTNINERTLWTITSKGTLSTDRIPKNAHRQQDAIALFQQHPNGLHEDSLAQMGIKKETLLSLEKKEMLVQKQENLERSWPTSDTLFNEPPQSLNPEQRSAYEKVATFFGNFKSFLLYGITGSGKTEVYLHLIADCLRKQQQALVIVPEISLTPQTVSRFQRRFNAHIGLIHSEQTDLERYNAWYEAREGSATIIIGTRSALFTDFKNLGLIIVDEEHDSSFKQQEGFRYSARDLAIYRAKQESVPILLGSATPSLESWYNTNTDRYELLKLSSRAGKAALPEIHAIDLREGKSRDGLSEYAKEIIQQRLQAGEQILIFLNRRGFAPVLICNNCGWTAQCSRCDARMILHKQPPHLHCHHCNKSEPILNYCRHCNSSDLTGLGQGTEKIETVLQENYPEYPVIRIDRDSTRRKGALKKVLEKIESQEPLILVGTQMISKGHHFPNVTTVIILDIDGGLLSADFRGTERTAQLVTQVAGRAGRGEKKGTVYIQTRAPEHPLLQLLLSNDYAQSLQLIMHEREASGFPPFGHLALFRAESVNQNAAMDFLSELKTVNRLQSGSTLSNINELEVLGPSPAPMTKKAGMYRAQLLLHSAQRRPLHQLIDQMLLWIDSQKHTRKIRLTLDIDPIDLF